MSIDGRESIDVTLNWNSFITGAYTEKNLRYRNGNNTATEAEINAWRDSYNNKQYWSVSQRCETSNYCLVYVVWSTSNNMSLTWQTNGVLVGDNSDIYVAELNYNTGNSNDIDVYINKTSARRIISMPSLNISNLFAFVSDYNYPADYEGEEIPAELPEEEDTVGTAYKPLWMYKVIDKRIILNDLTPNNILEEHKIELCLFQIPTNEWGDTFIEYQYDCLEKPDVKHKFEEYGAYNILHRQYSPTENKWYEISETITIDGSSFSRTSVDLKTCFNEVFPFVHVDKCTDNVQLITNLLSFRTVEFKNIYEIMGCRQLAVIDDWINKPDIILCPQVPQYIRSIITPFVTLLLGLVMIKFITKKEGYL